MGATQSRTSGGGGKWPVKHMPSSTFKAMTTKDGATMDTATFGAGAFQGVVRPPNKTLPFARYRSTLRTFAAPPRNPPPPSPSPHPPLRSYHTSRPHTKEALQKIHSLHPRCAGVSPLPSTTTYRTIVSSFTCVVSCGVVCCRTSHTLTHVKTNKQAATGAPRSGTRRT